MVLIFNESCEGGYTTVRWNHSQQCSVYIMVRRDEFCFGFVTGVGMTTVVGESYKKLFLYKINTIEDVFKSLQNKNLVVLKMKDKSVLY